MPAQPNRSDALRTLGTKTLQRVASAGAVLRIALARLVTSAATERDGERRTR